MKAIRVVSEIDQAIAVVDFDLHLIEHREPQHSGYLHARRIAYARRVKSHHVPRWLPKVRERQCQVVGVNTFFTAPFRPFT